MDGFKITNVDHLDHVDLCEEEQTLTDGSTVHNVVLRTPRGGRVRFCMTDESALVSFASALAKLLNEYGDYTVAVEIDGDVIPEPRRDDPCPRLSGLDIALAEALDRDEMGGK